MSMLSGQGLSPAGDGRRKRHPVATTIIVLLMMAVLFGAAYGVMRLIRGDSGGDPAASGSPTPTPCTTATVVPGVALPKPGQVTSNVYNSTDRAGLAKRTATELARRGFVISKVANDPLGKTISGVGEIRYGAAGLKNAQLMRYYVLGAALVQDDRKDATIDVVLGVKFSAVTPQAKVDAALKKPTVVVSGTGCPSPTVSPAASKPAASPSPTSS